MQPTPPVPVVTMVHVAAAPGPDALQAAALARLVGESRALHEVKRRLVAIARASGSVLVQGPSGTGKELAARLVHELSSRAAGPFVAIDCGALSEGVLESELFGHARGAFTGAAAERAGLFEAAQGGTIFLDEIANTSLQMQARLLRVLQEREVRRVGCNVSRRVDVRVIAATNRSLQADARAGSFREDLLYRLDVLGLRMPGLGERREDIGPLSAHVLAEIASATGRTLRLSAGAAEALVAHDWPGNVRELRNALELAAAFAEDGIVRREHLPERVAGAAGAESASLQAARSPLLQVLLDDFERRLLLARLSENGWNRTRTAGELGITRRTLFTKMLKHGLSEDEGRAATWAC